MTPEDSLHDASGRAVLIAVSFSVEWGDTYMRRASICAAAAFVLGSSSAVAGYEKAAWGMSLAEVQRLYPGGHVIPGDQEARSYTVIASLPGLPMNQLVFNFGQSGKLSYVTRYFPQSGGDGRLSWFDIGSRDADDAT